MARGRPTDVGRALIDAAIGLAEEQGAGAIGLREAARRAGVTHGAPYRHFASREALVAKVAEEGFQQLLTASVQALATAGPDPLARFGALGRSYLLFAIAHPGHFRVMFAAETGVRQASVRNAEAAVFSLSVNEIVACQRAGSARPGDPQALALVAWAGVHGLAHLWLDGLVDWIGLGDPDPEAFARRYSKRIFEGLLPAPAPPAAAPRPRRRVERAPRRR